MPLAKSKNSVGLGNSLMNDRFGKGKGQDMRKTKGIQRTAPDGSTYVTTEKEGAAWTKMRSVTEQAALDEFLSTAELAGTDFTAEKISNVKIIHKDQKNPYLLSAAEERVAVRKQKENKKRLKVPRRPQWDDRTSAQQLDERERQSLLDWRRGLAQLQENDDLLMTPFERNLEVWRQLWRVIERSDLIVQIVDARNPLLFRCEDLEDYVKEVDPKKKNLLLINKADMMTLAQREAWARHFEEVGINYKFFSAELAKERNDARDIEESSEISEEIEEEDDNDDDEEHGVALSKDATLAGGAEHMEVADDEVDEELSVDGDGRQVPDVNHQSRETNKEESLSEESQATRIITTDELESLFLQYAPNIDTNQPPSSESIAHKTTIGLVGYPNVGKSSTINALIGAKKVSVSATPGKTKHFQTIHLSDQVILCDCPGLVFPNFATTKAELVCNGILPIDQLREYTGPAALVAQRIPKSYIEAIYGLKVPIRPLEEGGTGRPTGEEVLRAYATARGFSTTGHGPADESRAARHVLKDYVRGKLLFCHPPPSDPPYDPQSFNRELYDLAHLPQKRRAVLAARDESVLSESTNPSLMDHAGDASLLPVDGEKTRGMDKRFFGPAHQGNAGHLSKPAHQQTDSGKMLSGRKLKTMVALEKGIDPAELKMNGKKHFNGNKRNKVRGESYTT